jgi:hypothetical protein
MAQFPVFMFDSESTEEWIDDLQLDRATNGAARGRALYAARKLRIRAAYKALTTAQRAQIEAHYDAHRGADFAFVWRGTTYTVAYPKDAIRFAQVGSFWNFYVTVEQV